MGREVVMNNDKVFPLYSFEGVQRFKSVYRAIRRGLCDASGMVFPKRPFGNTNSSTNILRRRIYEHTKRLRRVQ